MHYSKNHKRKSLLSKILEKEGYCPEDVHWIEDFDRESITYQQFITHFSAHHLEWQNRGYREFYPHYPLKPEEVSLTMKHLYAMSLFAFHNEFKLGLFLEDDAILDNEFFVKLGARLDVLPEDFDVAFIGRGCKEGLDNVGSVWYENQTDRNTDSMIFSQKFCHRFLQHVRTNKVCFPIDHELNYFFKKDNSKVYWLNDPLVTQGSHLGVFDSFQDAHSRYLNKNLPIRNDLEELLE